MSFKGSKDRCYYDGSQGKCTRDHFIPKSKGGKYIVWACSFCQKSKKAMMPHEWIIQLKKNYDPSFVSVIEYNVNALYQYFKKEGIDPMKSNVNGNQEPIESNTIKVHAPKRKKVSKQALMQEKKAIEKNTLSILIEKHIATFLVDRGGIADVKLNNYIYLTMKDGSEFRLVLQKMKEKEIFD